MTEEVQTRRRRSDYEPQVLSPAELKDMIKDVNKELLDGTFEVLGLDITDNDARAKVRQDFVWLRSVREGSADFIKTTRKIGFGALASALVASLIAGWKLKFGGP